MERETRVYPACCQSAHCGRVECEGCQNRTVHDEFEAWRRRTGATREEPIWCPSVWTAQRESEE